MCTVIVIAITYIPSAQQPSVVPSRAFIMFTGTKVALVATLALIWTAPGQTHGFSPFIDRLVSDLHISRSALSGCYMFGTVTGGLSQPMLGSLLDRHGCRKVGAAVIIAFGIACLLMAGLTINWWLLAFAFLGMRMTGQASLSMCANIAINQWWVDRRGRINGYANFANSCIGAGIMPLLLNRVGSALGWRLTYVACAVVLLGMLLPIWWLVVRDSPEATGELPDGRNPTRACDAREMVTAEGSADMPGSEDNGGPPASSPAPAQLHEDGALHTSLASPKPTHTKGLLPSGSLRSDGCEQGDRDRSPPHVWTRGEAIRTPYYIVAALGAACQSALGTGFIFNIVSIMEERGMSEDEALSFFIPRALVSAGVTVAAGCAMDALGPRIFLSCGLLLQGATFFLTTLIRGATQAWLLGALNGVGSALVQLAGAVQWSHFFGREHLGAITAPAWTLTIVASGLGPFPLAAVHDVTGSYRNALYACTITTVAFAVLTFLVPTPRARANAGG